MLGAFLGVLSIRYRVDQIIGGTVINIFALGLTSFLGARILAEYPDLNQPGTFRPIGIPGLERLPMLGPLLFDNTIYGYLLFALVFGLWWAFYRTRWGLRVRAVGEHPRAADTVGINVLRTRYRSVIARRGGRRDRRDLVHARRHRQLHREHDGREGLHRPGGPDLRALAPGGRLRGGAGVRVLRGAADRGSRCSTRRSRPTSC